MLNVGRKHADTDQVFQTRALTADDLDETLAGLPSDFSIGALDNARLVVGPTGCTVLMAQASDSHPEIKSGDLAQATRMNLADHLSWVPFVDALVVTSQNDTGSIASVEVDLLIPLLVDGPTMLDPETISRMMALLNERRLKPGWIGIAR